MTDIQDNKQYIKQESQDLAQRLEVLALAVDTQAPDLDLATLHAVSDWCDSLRKVLSVLKDVAEAAMVRQVPKDTKVAHWVDASGQGYRTEVKYRAARTGVQRDDLYRAVKQTARVVDESTGEVYDDYKLLVTTLEKSYRFEPRWTEIKALGIDPDEYCVAKYEPQVITTPEQQEETK